MNVTSGLREGEYGRIASCTKLEIHTDTPMLLFMLHICDRVEKDRKLVVVDLAIGSHWIKDPVEVYCGFTDEERVSTLAKR